MKKNILYFLAFITVIFASCDPLEDTYNEVKPGNYKKEGMAITITTAYPTIDAAKTGIAKTLNTSYAQLGDGSSANVTYNSSALLPAQIKPADSVLTNVSVDGKAVTQYTVTDADYAVTNGNSFKNFSAVKVVEFLNTKFATKSENQLVVLSYVYFQSGVTTSAGAPVVETFLYKDGAWMKPYHVSEAQYKSAGKMTVFNFGSADDANLNSYFNTFLKSDAVVSATAKTGDVKYVSFTYFSSSRITSQRIRTLVFDGTNWAYKVVPSTNTLGFLKKNGTWIPDPTVYYTFVPADYTKIADEALTIGNVDNRANLKRFNNFNLVASQTTTWTSADVQAAILFIINKKFESAPADPTVFYNITYTVYTGSTGPATKKFVKTATGFAVAP
ncbi:hypothetical protein [Pedobacter nyackensis]|uniref:hypothetical protein n=1 Tax=Pedobacter nyackensis TaxID=475255 RepID=UPI00292E6F6B|nr:hypothetical protein [Pedobacter nyackensis]